ncbi:MAG: AMP-binding protein [Betaproteobacteria bacterium]|nr:AMP-binding protein [Betaproteobacteria bacterium]
MYENRPWLRFYGKVPSTLAYPEVTLYEAVAATALRVPAAIAWDFFGTRSTYAQLLADVDRCAAALAAEGLREGDRFLISMPTCPQAVIAFYAANRLGALPALIHPLSTASEITLFLDISGARMALTLDAFYGPLAAATPATPLERIVVARVAEYLPPLKRLGFWVAKGRKIPPVPADRRVREWSTLLAVAQGDAPRGAATTNDPAAILFSGGTTGVPKGILLSNRNFIAQGLQASAWCGLGETDSILAILPIFHGFGLGVCINTAFMAGGKSILVPQFSAEIVSKLLRSERPSVLVGVPTLFDALGKDPSLAGADLSCIKACFCGADTLPRPVKERFEALVEKGGGHVKLLEGYGLTEAVTGIMATPLTEYREGSIGIPFPDMLAKIVNLGTTEEAPVGEEGEICIAGPAVMLGYLDAPAATAETLRVHADGRTWLHTGDLGRMDADGFFYFVVRFKRMIKSSGFNVYPAQVEAVLAEYPGVAAACVIGVPDPEQVERVKACVVLRDPAQAGAAFEEALIAHCREQLIKWSCPREVEFVDTLPLTKVGKIDYRELVRRHVAAQEAAHG